jgi:hypothetical protein
MNEGAKIILPRIIVNSCYMFEFDLIFSYKSVSKSNALGAIFSCEFYYSEE